MHKAVVAIGGANDIGKCIAEGFITGENICIDLHCFPTRIYP